MNVGFIGLGAMGSRMAKNLIDAGHSLTVFNRSPEAPKRLAEAGARVATTPRETAEGADIVISMVTDDQAARALWLDTEQGALTGLRAGAIGVESSTVTPGFIAELNEQLTSAGARLLDAPVAGTLPQAEQRKLIYFVGGPEDAFEQAKPVLRDLAAGIHHVGASGNGALFKLVVNSLFAGQVVLMGELLGLLDASGVPPTAALEVLGELPVTSPAARGAASLIAAGKHDPLFPIDLVAKDMRYAAAAASEAGSRHALVTAIGDEFVEAQARGLGSKNVTGVAKLALK